METYTRTAVLGGCRLWSDQRVGRPYLGSLCARFAGMAPVFIPGGCRGLEGLAVRVLVSSASRACRLSDLRRHWGAWRWLDPD